MSHARDVRRATSSTFLELPKETFAAECLDEMLLKTLVKKTINDGVDARVAVTKQLAKRTNPHFLSVVHQIS